MVQRCTLQLALRVVVLLQAIQVLLEVMQGRIITLSGHIQRGKCQVAIQFTSDVHMDSVSHVSHC